MNELAFQLMSLQYELAMNMGGTLDGEEMLRSVVETLIRRLDSRSGAVFEVSDREARLVMASPRGWRPPGMTDASIVAAATAVAGPIHQCERLDDGAYRHVFQLLDFGMLALERKSAPLEPHVLRALEPLMARMGRSARACADHARLDATQRRFSALVETVPEVIFEASIGAAGRLAFEYVSPRARDLLDLEPRELLSRPERLLDRIEAGDRAALTEALARAAAGGEPFEQRVRLDARQIEPRWLLVAGRPRRNDASGGTRWSGIIQDVTAREVLAASRRASARAQFDTVLSAVDDAVIGADVAGVITHWNRGAERMLGHPASAALGRPLAILVPARLRGDHARGFARHVATGEQRVFGRPTEMNALHAEGHEVPVELMLSRTGEGSNVRFFAVLRDVTVRKEAERRLAFALEVQRAVAESSTLLLSVDLAEVDALVESTLGRLGRLTKSDRVYIFRSIDGLLYNTHEWSGEGVLPQKANLQGLPADDFGFFMQPLLAGQSFVVPSVRALPPEAAAERQILQAQDIETLVAVPLIFEGTFQGFLGVDNPRDTTADSLGDLATPLRVFAEVVAGVLHRVAGERELRALHVQISQRVAEQRALLRMSAELAATRSRAEFYGILDQRLGDAIPSGRLTLMTLCEGGRKVRIRLLGTALEPADRPAHDWLGMSASEIEVETEALVDQSVSRALVRGEILSVDGSTPDLFPDLAEMSERHGLHQFVIVPLIGPDGLLGCFRVGFPDRGRLEREKSDWVVQIGALLGAHIAAHEAREALQYLNTTLEERVASRTQAVQASEERFTLLFERAPQAMLLLGAGRLVTRANARARSLFRMDLDSPGDLPFDTMLPDYPGDGIINARRLDGTTFHAEISLVTVPQRGHYFDIVGVADVTERVEAQDAIVRSLQEKETLLKEVHHRVKNNLQIISSLLMLQSDKMPSDAGRDLLEQSVLRVRSMALIHEQLYGVETLDSIDFGEYARALAQAASGVLAPAVRLKIEAAVTKVTINEAIPMGLILNELLTNAFKYGMAPPGTAAVDRRNGAGCDVSVEIGVLGDEVRIAVIDSGNGLPEGLDAASASSLGLSLVRALTRQLRGRLTHDVDRGTRIVLTCPRSIPG
ncbi:MAG: PAS domain S-box protein [Burkholderiales bacterium]|nr:PAS domain S-box protein [Burkholderiales bacterium]